MLVGSDLDLNGFAKVVNSADPVNDQDLATKIYVDKLVQGLAWKDNVRVATQGNIDLSSPGSAIDGIFLSLGDRFLVQFQLTASQNGIYIWNGATTPATRSLDASTADELENAIVSVDEGTSAGTTWRQTTVNFTLGTNNIAWSAFNTAAPAASTSTPGIAAIATQAEVNAGTVSNKIVTPQTLAASSLFSKSFKTTIGDGSAFNFTITHNFNTRDVNVQVFRNSGNYDTIMVDVYRPTVNTIQVVFGTNGAAPSVNSYRVIIST